MTSIKVQDLVGNNISGSDSFDDSEGFIKELTETELLAINGGNHVVLAVITVAVVCFVAGFMETSQNCKP